MIYFRHRPIDSQGIQHRTQFGAQIAAAAAA